MTTKYTYFHTQVVSYLNNGYMPDPVSTAGASGGFEGVLNSINSGTPTKTDTLYSFKFKARLYIAYYFIFIVVIRYFRKAF